MFFAIACATTTTNPSSFVAFLAGPVVIMTLVDSSSASQVTAPSSASGCALRAPTAKTAATTGQQPNTCRRVVTPISTVTGSEVQQLLFKLDRASPYLPQCIPPCLHDKNLDRCATKHGGPSSIPPSSSSTTAAKNLNNNGLSVMGKHIQQVESIVDHMRHFDMILPLGDSCRICQSSPPTESRTNDSLGADESSTINSTGRSTLFIEFGCGAAKLSDHLSQQLVLHHQQQQEESSAGVHPSNNNNNHHFVLIDRQHFGANRMRDGAIRARLTASSPRSTVRRITQDIASVSIESILNGGGDTASVPTFIPTTKIGSHPSIVAMSKHLCGSAVEHTIQCLEDYSAAFKQQQQPSQQEQSLRRPLIPIAVATCCHYRCEKASFRDPVQFFWRLGFTDRDWEVMVIASQWASLKVDGNTHSFPVATPWPMEEKDTPFPPPMPIDPLSLAIDDAALLASMDASSADFEQSFSRHAKQSLGRRCKLVLDTARAHRLMSLGYEQVHLVSYTTQSLELHLLLAVPPSEINL